MSHRMRLFCVAIPALCAVSALCVATAYAAPPGNLADAIKQSTDRDRRRIPLLVLNAEQTRMDWQDGASNGRFYEMYREEGAKPPLADVLPVFKRQVVSCASVQVIAPINRVTINPYPGPPEEWARIGRERAARLLFTSLSPAQWATASSANGIGLSDLQKKEQKAWFLSLIPEPFVLHEMQILENNIAHFARNAKEEAITVTVAPEQVRVRVIRSMEWWYRRGTQGSYNGYGNNENAARRIGERYWTQQYAPQGQQTPESYRDRIKDAVRVVKPNRIQKGDLPFNAPPLFGKAIPLAGAKTLGELVRRVAEATGVELYADRRLTGMTVSVIGNEDAAADAADLMKALCLATTGTIREVRDARKGESVYLLAGDRDPLMPPRLYLAEWADDVDALLNGEQNTFQKTAMESGVVRGIGFSQNAAEQISDGVMQAAEERIMNPRPYPNNDSGFIPIPVNKLPPAGQAKVQSDLARGLENASPGEPPLDDKNVYAQFSVKTQLLVPAYGAFSGPSLTSLDTLLKRNRPAPTPTTRPAPPSGAISLPPALQKFAALKVAPKNDDEADAAARWARRHGFCALFIPALLWEDGETDRLSRIATIGRKYGVKVYPVVSLLRVPAAESAKKETPPHNLARGRNIFGETLRAYAYRRKDTPALLYRQSDADLLAPLRDGDWLDASDAAVQKAVAERLALFARIPGIAGMVWGSVAAPGTAINGYSWSTANTTGRHAGFTDALRIAFIRQENADPLDLPPYGDVGPYIDWSSGESSPFQGNDWEMRDRLRQNPVYRKDATTGAWKSEKPTNANSYDFAASAWNTLVREQNRSWIGAIRKAASLPDSLPVFIEAPAEPGRYSATPWVCAWAPTEALMPSEMGKEPLMAITFRADTAPAAVRTLLGVSIVQRLGKTKTPPFSGVVIDLTTRQTEDGLSLLSPLATVAN